MAKVHIWANIVRVTVRRRQSVIYPTEVYNEYKIYSVIGAEL